jgi:uncharacterized membrane protein
MKFNKTYLALYGGITAGFFVLGIAYVLFGEGKTNKTDVAILFSVASTLLASFVVLYEEQRKRRNKVTKCSADKDTVTYYVP